MPPGESNVKLITTVISYACMCWVSLKRGAGHCCKATSAL